jgi:outer membrane protein
MRFIKTIAIACLLLITSAITAQELKFGHVNVQELIMELPDKKDADTKLQAEAQILQDRLKVMSEEHEKKYRD